MESQTSQQPRQSSAMSSTLSSAAAGGSALPNISVAPVSGLQLQNALQQPAPTPSSTNLGLGGSLAASLFGTVTSPPTASSVQPLSTANSVSVQYPTSMTGHQSVLTPQVIRSLSDKVYEKRKAAAIEIEKLVRDALIANDSARIGSILMVLAHEFAYSIVPNTRNGGLIGLAAAAIALGPAIDSHLMDIVPPMLACFSDQDSRVRYYASEALYNVCKVARASILIYFNEIFDALCKLSVDQESSVKSGAGLLDRIIKDIVSERSTYYHSDMEKQAAQNDVASTSLSKTEGDMSTNSRAVPVSVPVDSTSHPLSVSPVSKIFPPVPGTTSLRPGMSPTSFNLPRFIPLLAERIYVVTPAARIFLVQWIYLLSSIPDLELISYLPEFLDGLFRFLSDPNVDVRTATLNVLVEFLKELRDIVQVQREQGILQFGPEKELPALAHSTPIASDSTETPVLAGLQPHQDLPSKSTYVDSPHASGSLDAVTVVTSTLPLDGVEAQQSSQVSADKSSQSMTLNPSSVPYISGQGVSLDFGKMTHILVPHLSSQDEETQATALRWINEFILLAKDTMIPFMPLILQSILRTLSHSVIAIRNMAIETNSTLYALVLGWSGNITTSSADSTHDQSLSSGGKPDAVAHLKNTPFCSSRLELDVSACVNILTLLFQDEMEYTRAAAIDWLTMLHKKAPEKVMHSSDQRTFQALLGTLSDLSEEVVKRDLQLLAQISHYSDDQYFTNFMDNLLTLFSSDRRLLETRGNLIIRQLCFSLNPERMYRSFAELIENEQDIEFASTMVQNLNLILVTSPELSELRRRLKNLDSKDGSALFATLYRSWCHNAVAVLSLCLLAQAYEHASHLVSSFGDLEITVPFLVQIDRLVQLLESPVFTYLRLQLLEPDCHPHLFKCLYGVLMLLPQSSAFATLRNRLSSVGPLISLYNTPNGLGSMSTSGAAQTGSTLSQSTSHSTRSHRSKSGGSTSTSGTSSQNQHHQDFGIRWQDLIAHFRNIQHRQERSRRQATRLTSVDRPHKSRHDGDGSNTGMNSNSINGAGLLNPNVGGNSLSGSLYGNSGNPAMDFSISEPLNSLHMSGSVGTTHGGSGSDGTTVSGNSRKERVASIASLSSLNVGSGGRFRALSTPQTIPEAISALPVPSSRPSGSNANTSNSGNASQASRSAITSRRGASFR
ncbi:hypothetical protein O5D80_001496 [Batrachochytrium dendrobatidis]|nr:hypothetical protein O5D80_001496 [Batrachochytrium dendrobatidis]